MSASVRRALPVAYVAWHWSSRCRSLRNGGRRSCQPTRGMHSAPKSGGDRAIHSGIP